jgi:hypothetical protein
MGDCGERELETARRWDLATELARAAECAWSERTASQLSYDHGVIAQRRSSWQARVQRHVREIPADTNPHGGIFGG